MPKIIVLQPFSFSDNGYTLVDHAPGAEPVEVSEECAGVAVAEGWAQLPTEGQTAAHKGAPENRDAARQPRTVK